MKFHLSFLSKAHEKCKQIKGFLVEFPLQFLADDVLMPKWNTSEGDNTSSFQQEMNSFFSFECLGMAPILLWT